MKVTIAKALKMKNRIAEKIKKLDVSIRDNNSVRSDIGTDVDVLDLFEQKESLVDNLVELKAGVARANFDIQDKIFRMSELKGLISFMSSLNTKSGKIENTDYRRTENDPSVYQYKAAIDRELAETHIETYQETLDKLQDEVDLFNATKKIELTFL